MQIWFQIGVESGTTFHTTKIHVLHDWDGSDIIHVLSIKCTVVADTRPASGLRYDIYYGVHIQVHVGIQNHIYAKPVAYFFFNLIAMYKVTAVKS